MNIILLTCALDWGLILHGVQILTTIFVAWLVYKFTQKNMKYETEEKLGRFRKEKLMEAGMAFWSLLAYTTQQENEKSILLWTSDKEGMHVEYYIHIENALFFIQRLNEINYLQGHGIFLRSSSRALFYEYRNNLYGFLLANRNVKEGKIKVQNEEMVARMKQIHDEAILALKQEMEV